MPTHATISEAVVAALADLTVIETARTATIPTKDGRSYGYKYADLADVVRATRPVLSEHGLVALTPIVAHEKGLACQVMLLHTSGDMMDLGEFPFPHGANAQATGSMVTYHRRYALLAALGMAAGDDDDDGAKAVSEQVKIEDLPVVVSKAIQENLMYRIGQLSADHQTELVDWFHEYKVPPVRRLTEDRLEEVEAIIAHYENLEYVQEEEKADPTI